MIEHNHRLWPHCTSNCTSAICEEEGCQAGMCQGVHRIERDSEGSAVLMPDFDERPWFECRVSFEAISRADAEFILDRIAETVCRGHGDGEDHECKFQFVISGPVEIELEMDDEEG